MRERWRLGGRRGWRREGVKEARRSRAGVRCRVGLRCRPSGRCRQGGRTEKRKETGKVEGREEQREERFRAHSYTCLPR